MKHIFKQHHNKEEIRKISKGRPIARKPIKHKQQNLIYQNMYIKECRQRGCHLNVRTSQGETIRYHALTNI